MSITCNFHDPKRADNWTLEGLHNALCFEGDNGENISMFVPPHVAEHVAAAFNRAMQAVPDQSGGWTYTAKSGVWHISNQHAAGYHAQHDEITGDEDPGFYFAEGDTLLDCMDVIDAIGADHGCLVCHKLFDDGELAHCHDGEWRCDDCAQEWVKREAEMREMAEDDKAHAAMERAAGL